MKQSKYRNGPKTTPLSKKDEKILATDEFKIEHIVYGMLLVFVGLTSVLIVFVSLVQAFLSGMMQSLKLAKNKME